MVLSRYPVLIILDGHIIVNDYRAIIDDLAYPVIQTLYPEGGAVYQDNNAPVHTSKSVTEWFDEHETEVEHLSWPAQSPDLSIIEQIWRVLEKRVMNHPA